MQGTTTMLRTGTRLLLMAFLSLVLVALGAAGAQAIPAAPAHPASSVPAATAASTAAAALEVAATPAPESFGSVGAPASGPAGAQDGPPVLVQWADLEQTTCIPGRKKVRLESAAVVPSYALLQHAPESGGRFLPHAQVAGSDGVRPSGRIPASLTHLDLGIVRT